MSVNNWYDGELRILYSIVLKFRVLRYTSTFCESDEKSLWRHRLFPLKENGTYIFCLGRNLLWRTLVWEGRLYGRNFVFLNLRYSSLERIIHLKENLPVVNNYFFILLFFIGVDIRAFHWKTLLGKEILGWFYSLFRFSCLFQRVMTFCLVAPM